MNTIRELVNQGIKVLQQMRINYNSPIGHNTMQLINISKQLIPNLQKEQPEIADILNNALSTINFNGKMHISSQNGRFLPSTLMDSYQHILLEILELVIGF